MNLPQKVLLHGLSHWLAEGFSDSVDFLPAGIFPCGSSTLISFIVGASFFFVGANIPFDAEADDAFASSFALALAFAASSALLSFLLPFFFLPMSPIVDVVVVKCKCDGQICVDPIASIR